MSDQHTEGPGLLTLIGQTPDRIRALIKAEVDQAKADLSFKAKHFGIGSGMFGAAAFVSVFLIGTLIAAGILGLAVVMPGWAAALVVSGLLLLLIGVLIGIGVASFKKGSAPLDAVSNIKTDIHALKGYGNFDSRK